MIDSNIQYFNSLSEKYNIPFDVVCLSAKMLESDKALIKALENYEEIDILESYFGF